jgi:paxillin
MILALDKVYHPDHFVCFDCKKPIKESKFQENNNEPYCDSCYSKKFLKKCKACGEPIKDVSVLLLTPDTFRKHLFDCSVIF